MNGDSALTEVAARVVASWSEPTDEQLQLIAAMLRASSQNGGATGDS